MRSMLLTLTTLLQASLLGEQTMYVSICNQSGTPESMVTPAKTEVELTFQPAGVKISWVACQSVANLKEQLGDQLFVVRLRNEKPLTANRNVSLDTMGRAYTNEREAGFLADAYVPSIRKFAETWDVDADELLGLVISHELGHLMLGPGHVATGIMYGNWNTREVQAMRKRWLRFNPDERLAIRDRMQIRAQRIKPALDGEKQ